MASSTLLLCFVALLSSAHGQSTAGFLSIDCGHAGEAYRDNATGILYSPDNDYIGTGVNRNVSSEYDYLNFGQSYGDLRSFPDGERNCYTLPVLLGKKFLVRAGFVYGNYDGQNQPPEFDLYLDVHFWTRVKGNSSTAEIIAVAPAYSMQVCLVKNGSGTPFISALDLRPLADSMYTWANASQLLVLRQDRYNYGGQPNIQIRYPEDPYDRVWHTPDNQNGWKPLISSDRNARVKLELEGEFPVPSAIMRTAITTGSLTELLNFTVSGNLGDEIYLTMHFAELKRLGANESRVFNVYRDSGIWFTAYRPPYLQAGYLYTLKPGQGRTSTYSLASTGNSTLPPILNALEVYTLQHITQLPTDEEDVTAILSIKRLYKLGRNWEGDPCSPRQLMWEGLGCRFGDSEKARIISLNLSYSNLTGSIPASIASLRALRSLDLSHNNLTGEIPWNLGDLPVLNILNLRSNQLAGSVPQKLANKSENGLLSLSIDGNPDLCIKMESCRATREKKRRKFIAPIIISASASIAVLLAILLFTYFMKRPRKQSSSKNYITHEFSVKKTKPIDNNKQKDVLQTQSHQFTFSAILTITQNFEKVIGKGGYGIVYLGYLPDKTEVGVKLLSQSLYWATKEFQSMAHTLMRVHHRNLVSLVGYCVDMNNLALLYKFMPQGSLATHLSGDPSTIKMLSWRMRLIIALDSAQGLNYLHTDCNPSIVHGDVRTTNILLDENFTAKLIDFGLWKAFSNEDRHLSIAITSTSRYLDPEYNQTHRFDEKSDIYSFGIVLLEVITGRLPIFGEAEEIHITKWAHARIKEGNIESIVDHRLQRNYEANSMKKVVDIAMACASSLSSDRPTITEVVAQLKECLDIEEARNHSSTVTQSSEIYETAPLILNAMTNSPTR